MPDMAGRTLLLRADAGPRTGSGHVMRCLALAQAWRDAGGEAVLAAAERLPALDGRLAAEGLLLRELGAPPGSAADAAATAAAAADLGADWVVVDGYRLGGDYLAALGGALGRLACLDDQGLLAHPAARVIVNQNLDPRPEWYAGRDPGAQLLLGPDFALLRREFRLRRRPTAPPGGPGRRLLLTLGGADPDDLTARVLAGLGRLSLPGLAVRVVLGAGYRDAAGLAPALAALGDVELLVNPPDMAAWMAWADLAVAAGGVTCWELAAMGLPAALLVLAENQRANVAGLAARGAAVSLGEGRELAPTRLAEVVGELLADGERRAAMAAAGRDLVDGQGARRVLAALEAEERLRARPATAADAEPLFAWANDPVTRRASFRDAPIAWEEHLGWLAGVLADPARRLFILEWGGPGPWQPIGQVRLDADGTVSMGLAPAWRGRGLAAPALRRALAHPLARRSGPALLAYIKPENGASARAFRQAGFIREGPDRVAGLPCERYRRPAAWAPAAGQWTREEAQPC